ncbi:MAG: hypothetical protein ACLTKG_04895 [Collinsella intestinalis]
MTVFSSDAEHAEIVYYENQKANAIAPRVTDKAASTVRQQIDETFAKTISDVGLATTSSLLEFMDGDQIAAYAGNLSGTLAGAITTLRDASGSVDEFAGCCSHPPACSIRRAICWRALVRRARMPRPLWATRKRA